MALLILTGSAGWVLSDHLCRSDNSGCDSSMEVSCCCSDEEQEPAIPVDTDNFFSGEDACCINQTAYFSMPVYRIDVSRDVQPDFTVQEVAYTPFLIQPISRAASAHLHWKPPISQIGGVSFLHATGLLLI